MTCAASGPVSWPGRGRQGHCGQGYGYALRDSAVVLLLWLAPVTLLFAALGPANVFAQIAGLFSVMAVVTFGGAYAVLAHVGQEALQKYGWLAPGEMLDGLGMAETTPWPLIMVTQFVGFSLGRSRRVIRCCMTLQMALTCEHSLAWPIHIASAAKLAKIGTNIVQPNDNCRR